MTTQVTNTLGYVPLMDGGNPRSISFTAKTNISGGTFVVFSGNSNVGSQASSFATSDLVGEAVSVYGRVNGITTQYVGSNTVGTVVTRGLCLVKSAAATSGGQLIAMSSGGNYDAVIPIHGINAGSIVQGYIGRALTCAGSEDYLVASLNI